MEMSKDEGGRMKAERGRRFKPYPAYKDSGVEWLGEIPVHWEVKRLKLYRANGSTTVRTTRDEVIGVFRGDCRELGIGWTSTTTCSMSLMASRLHVLSRTRRVPCKDHFLLTNGGASGNVDLPVHGRFISRTQCSICFRANRAILTARYATSTRTLTRLHFRLRRRRHLMASIRQKRLTSRHHRVPNSAAALAEQRAIAAFLDRETARIDALVAKNERLIELLQEKRAALITRAVTKGLDPTVPMKDSGVEWLGEIPAHWKVKPLRWVSHFQRGHDLPNEEREVGEVPVVTSSGPSSTHSRAIAKAPGIVTGSRYGMIGKFYRLQKTPATEHNALYDRLSWQRATAFCGTC